jgi:hypothetical protein
MSRIKSLRLTIEHSVIETTKLHKKLEKQKDKVLSLPMEHGAGEE